MTASDAKSPSVVDLKSGVGVTQAHNSSFSDTRQSKDLEPYSVTVSTRDVIVTSADVHAPDYVTTASLFGGRASPAEKTPTNDVNDVFEDDYYGQVLSSRTYNDKVGYSLTSVSQTTTMTSPKLTRCQ